MRDVGKFKRNMRVAMGIFISLFLLLIGYMCYSIVAYGEKWFATPYNPRLQAAIQTIDAGALKDANGVRLAWTENGKRVYHKDKDVRKAVSHVVGDSMGKSLGAETTFSKYIYGMDKDVLQRLKDIQEGKSNEGSDVTLTIDSSLSEYIYNQMDGKKGSVVVLNYKTGEIVASVSNPSFDPEKLKDSVPEDTSLVDRATMGRYPPGSIMKIVTAAAAVEQGLDMEYECTGEAVIEGQKVTCAGGAVHGKLNLKQAVTKSCNIYFAHLSVKLGAKALADKAADFGFNTDFRFGDITLYKSNFETSPNQGDVAWAGIGQYNDLITPMHAAMIAGAVANGGVMMEPKLLKNVEGNSVFHFSFAPSVYKRVMSEDTAATLREYMKEVVQKGTGASAQVKGGQMYGKTGTAEFEEDGQVKNHSWFMGFIDDEDHPYAIAVIFEGAGFGSKYAAPMAGKVMSKIVRS